MISKPPRGQTACWVYLCDGKPEILVKLNRRFPEAHIKVWMCRPCAKRLAHVEPTLPLFQEED